MIEITTPASTIDLTTQDMVLDRWVGVEPDADVVDFAIASASRTIARWCRREFVRQEYTELLSAPDRSKLLLAESPIVSVSEVLSGGDPVTDYSINSSAGILLKDDYGVWTGPVRYGGLFGTDELVSDPPLSLSVTYISGWITRSMDAVDFNLPADVEDACIEFATELLKMEKDEPVSDPSSIKIGGFTTEYSPTDTMTGSGSGYWAEAVGDPSLLWLPLRVRRILMLYRRTL